MRSQAECASTGLFFLLNTAQGEFVDRLVAQLNVPANGAAGFDAWEIVLERHKEATAAFPPAFQRVDADP